MRSHSAVRAQGRAVEFVPSAASEDDDASLSGSSERAGGWPVSVVSGLTIAVAFVLGAALIYRSLFAALAHVR